jgi:hypothetical protein
MKKKVFIKKKKMWPLNYSASCILVVLDFSSTSSSSQQQQQEDQALELCYKSLDATRTMVDFAPATTSAVLKNNTNNSSDDQQQQQQQRIDPAMLSSFERPAGAVYAVVNLNKKKSLCACLWSPIQGSGEDENENSSSSCRNGNRVRQIVKERFVQLLGNAKKQNNNSNSNHYNYQLTPATLEGLIRCTGTVQQLASGNGYRYSKTQPQQQLPSLIRVLSLASQATNEQLLEEQESTTTTQARITSWKDSLCSLISTWEKLNIQVSVEIPSSLQLQSQKQQQNATTCPILQYLLSVSSSVVFLSLTEKSNQNNNNNSYQLAYVCPKCRSMKIAISQQQQNEGMMMDRTKILSVIALQEHPKCPRGCTAF